MPQSSARLVRQIHTDFPQHGDIVLARLTVIDDLLQGPPPQQERIQAAVIRIAAGRLDRLNQALDLARTDWRDLLVAADLADGTWPAKLSAWLDSSRPQEIASPGTTGELTEADGHRWTLRRRRIDLRVVRRLLRRTDTIVVVGESGGFRPRRIADPERASVWETVRHAYGGPGGTDSAASAVDYQGYEFVDGEGTVMLYLEENC